MLVGANVPPRAGLIQPSPRRPRAAPLDRSTSSAPWPQTPPGARLQHRLHHRRLSGCSGRGDVDGGTRAMVKAASGVPIENFASHASITVTNPAVW